MARASCVCWLRAVHMVEVATVVVAVVVLLLLLMVLALLLLVLLLLPPLLLLLLLLLSLAGRRCCRSGATCRSAAVATATDATAAFNLFACNADT